jgi:hypothetical protein
LYIRLYADERGEDGKGRRVLPQRNDRREREREGEGGREGRRREIAGGQTDRTAKAWEGCWDRRWGVGGRRSEYFSRGPSGVE